MKSAKRSETNETSKGVTFNISHLLCGLMILSGLACMVALAGMKEDPVHGLKESPPLTVAVQTIRFETYPTAVTGYGSVVCRDSADVSCEVSGRVAWVNPDLETGRLVQSQAVLFKIDPVDLENRQRQESAREKQIQQKIKNLTDQHALDRERIKSLERNLELALARYQRFKSLYENHRVGSKDQMDTAEMELNSARLSQKALEKKLINYIGEIQIEKFNLETCRVRLEEICLNLERCTVRSPFSGRIKACSVEKGIQVKKADPVITLCNDTSLEIHVPLAGEQMAVLSGSADRNRISGRACSVRWSGSGQPSHLRGRVDRVVEYSKESRTFLLAVTVDLPVQKKYPGQFTIMEGMFCEVSISGIPLKKVARLPRKALLKGDTLLTISGEQLIKKTVTIARESGHHIYVRSGLTQGDVVVVSQVTEADLARKIKIIQSGENRD